MYTQDGFVVDFNYRFVRVKFTTDYSTLHLYQSFHTEDFFHIEIDPWWIFELQHINFCCRIRKYLLTIFLTEFKRK